MTKAVEGGYRVSVGSLNQKWHECHVDIT